MVVGQPTVDGSDALVTACAWAITWAAGRWLTAAQRKDIRDWLPVLAVGSAVLLRAVLAWASGEPVGVDAMLRGFASGAAATWGHATARAPRKRQERRGKASDNGG